MSVNNLAKVVATSRTVAGPGREPRTSGPECQRVNHYTTELHTRQAGKWCDLHQHKTVNNPLLYGGRGSDYAITEKLSIAHENTATFYVPMHAMNSGKHGRMHALT